MSKIIPTELEIFHFGDKKEDIFYLLFDKRIFDGEVDLNQLRLAEPRKFDQILNDMGCVMMLTGDEVEELTHRGDLNPDEVHQSLVELAVKEGILK